MFGDEVMVMATAAGVGGEPGDVRCGGFPAWPLPLDARGAAVARSLVRSVFKALGMPAEMTCDVAVAISELATNVHLHALRGAASVDSRATGAPEMWAYLRWRTRPEVVLKVFDTTPWHGPVMGESDGQGPPRPAPEAEGGRGLEVVHALTSAYGGHWGVHRTRSRLGAEAVPGKAVFVVVPVPRGCGAAAFRPVRRHPQEVRSQVHALLAARGLGRLEWSAGHGLAVMCVRAGVHVWVFSDSLACWSSRHGRMRHPLCDAVEVVEQVVAHCADLDAEGR
jgi:hypothetical protein